MSRRSRLIFAYWMPAVLWAAVVLCASSDLFSSQHSGDWLGEIIITVIGHPLPPRQFNVLHFLVRKASHLTEYAILGALLFRALRGDERGWRAGWAAGAVALALCVAVSDEWHQMFVVSRTSSAWDVLLDGVGAAVAQMLVILSVGEGPVWAGRRK